VYCNEERTRTFLGIHCQNDDGTLRCLAAALDSLLAEYELPSFYQVSAYAFAVVEPKFKAETDEVKMIRQRRIAKSQINASVINASG